jgi:hypothetical protein
MSEDQKKETFDKLPADKKQGQTYTEWIKSGYQHQYENWMPWVYRYAPGYPNSQADKNCSWIEDKYLSWFTNDNKTSYAAKGKTHLMLDLWRRKESCWYL